jgi:hypothetical protein
LPKRLDGPHSLTGISVEETNFAWQEIHYHPAPLSSHYWLCYPIWWNVDTLHLWGQQFLCDV